MSDSRSDSDDEAPEQVSFDTTKTKAQLEARLVTDLARNEKAARKRKRCERQELFKKQKQEKETRSLVFTDDVLNQIRNETDATRPDVTASPKLVDASPHSTTTEGRRKGVVVKTYKSLNIDVRALTHVHNPRRMTAANFKARRFGKVHRENLTMNQVHAEKLRAGGKL